ncbi:MAG: C-terminal binding protein [Planctomyces sp.]|nr:C-terminal binding protein [Planctomyces sp.]
MSEFAFKVLLTDRAWPSLDIEESILAASGAQLIEAPSGDERTLCELAADVDAIATNWAKVTPAVIAAATKLKTVARLGIGLDNIALADCTARGIPVTNSPDYCTHEVSDHALGLLLALSRKIAFFHHRTKQGEYNLGAGLPLTRIKGQTLGLVGLGNTARALVPKARALGLEILAHTTSGNDYDTGCGMVSFEDLLSRSDFISVHAPLTPSTRKMFGTEQFRCMKSTAYLINTSRGGLIDEAALWEAIQAGEIAGAALDVFDPEPCDLNQPLFRDERVIVTPHAAFISEQSLAQMRSEVMEQIVQVFRGEKPRNQVNLK